MSELIFFLEEASAKELLRQLLPRMFPENDVCFIYKVYEGKSDLQKNMLKDMREHARVPGARFLVLHDQDYADCLEVKQKLQSICRPWLDRTFVRIACKELESWYLAQLHAVDTAFKINSLGILQNKAKFREPDRLATPDLILVDLLKTKRKTYSKLSGSRAMGEHIDPDCSRSTSFSHFITAVRASVQSIREQAAPGRGLRAPLLDLPPPGDDPLDPGWGR